MSKQTETKTSNGAQASESQTYKQRFLYALFPCGLLCFIYLFFGPLSLIHNNTAAFHLTISQATPWYLGAFVAATAALAAALALLRGRVFDGAVTFTLWAGIASYIQRNMLNIDFGLLDGKTIPWHEYTSQALLNLGVWLALLLAVSIAAALLGKRWKKVVCFASAILILMQTTALVTFYFSSGKYIKGISDYYLSAENTTRASDDENVFIFVLDAASNHALEQTLDAFPDTLSAMDDFTYYRNCAPTFYGTYPELISILTTNPKYDASRSYLDFERESWGSPSVDEFYSLLKENDYQTFLFTKGTYISQHYANIDGKVDNAEIIQSDWQTNPTEMYKKLGLLTFWEYMPTMLKACFYTTPADFDTVASSAEQSAYWVTDGSKLFNPLSVNGLSVTDGNVFALYHLPGAHPYFTVNEEGMASQTETSLERQLKGNFVTISEFIRQLKDIGVYDNSTIIITADHGDYHFSGSQKSNSVILFVKQRGETRDEMRISDAPVTHLELLPTIASEVDPDNTCNLGRTLSDIGEDEVRERTLYRWMRVDNLDTLNYDHFYLFKYTCNINDLNDLSEPDEVLPLYDSLY